MANRFLFLGLGCLVLACGGRASINAVGGGQGQGGGFVSSGGAGAVGDAGSVAAGGAATAGAPSSGAPGIDWAVCVPSDLCVLETETACGAGCEPIPLSRFIPINSRNEAAYKKQQVVPPCISGECPYVPPSMVNAPNYYATCQVGRCQGVDVRTSSLSKCEQDNQCYLRYGTSCCDCGTIGDLIAVSSLADVDVTFCGLNGGCAADCVSPPPPLGIAAYCSSSGHCLVKYPDSASDAGPAQ
jgi:hypothetical protein